MTGRAGRWIRFSAAAVGFVIVAGYAVVQVSFRSWRAGEYARVDAITNVLTLEKGRLEYAFAGEAGPAVLFFHGAGGGADRPLHLEGFRVLTPSRPGYLRTDLSVGRTLPEAASSYAELLDSLGIERVTVVGLSAGGPSALEFASRYPDRLSALVLVSAISKQRPRPLPERGHFARVTDVLVGEGFSDWLLTRLVTRFPKLLISDPENEYLSVADLELLRSDPDRLARMADLFSSMLRFSKRRMPGFVNDRIQYGRMGEPDLPIAAPTLVIHGTADRDVGFDHAESAARRIHGAELFPVKDAGHMAFYLRPDRIRPKLLDFLETHTAERGERGNRKSPDPAPGTPTP